MSQVVIKVIKPKEKLEYKETIEAPIGEIAFWNSLFCWMALLAAFKYWLSTQKEREANPNPSYGPNRPKKVLINNRIHDLNAIKVLDGTLLIEGRTLTRAEVNLAGFILEINGELYLDLSDGKGFNTIESLPDKIIVNKEN